MLEDQVDHPSHYVGHYPFEVKDAIKLILNELCPDLTGFDAYCLGNQLKYRLRAGHKGDLLEDISKALKYGEFMEGPVPEQRTETMPEKQVCSEQVRALYEDI